MLEGTWNSIIERNDILKEEPRTGVHKTPDILVTRDAGGHDVSASQEPYADSTEEISASPGRLSQLDAERTPKEIKKKTPKGGELMSTARKSRPHLAAGASESVARTPGARAKALKYVNKLTINTENNAGANLLVV